MFEPQAKKSTRETVRDTFTPARVGLLSWAFAALVMGTVGLASFQFGTPQQNLSVGTLLTAGLPLPPAGEVRTTASTGTSGNAMPVEVMQMPQNTQAAPLGQSQIEVMQREIVGLRRRLSALSEQNLAYSKRIAALEMQVAKATLSGSPMTASAASDDRPSNAEPKPGIVVARTGNGTSSAPAPVAQAPKTPAKPQSREGEQELPAQSASQADPKTPPNAPPQAPLRLIDLYQDRPTTTEAPDATTGASREPVRIVTLPQPSNEPVTTGSIPTAAAETLPERFDATPTQTFEKPRIITPSEPSGRLRGGERQIKRSDFGAVIGHYKSSAAAAKAWADFKNQNAERMRDLHPLLLEREGPKGGISLLVGPFANAADAAVACLHLLDATELCHPAIYAGDPLVSAADFRESAF